MRPRVLVAMAVAVCGATMIAAGPEGPAPRASQTAGPQGAALQAETSRRVGRIAGRIALPAGTPAPGSQVRAVVRRSGALEPIAQTLAGWDGRYELTDVPAGDVLVLAIPAPAAIRARAALNEPPLAPTLYP